MKTAGSIPRELMLLVMAFMVLSARAQNQDALKQFVGKWNAMVSFSQSGGQFTISRTDQAEVKQTDRNTIEFTLKPVASDEPVFQTRLTFDISSKSYLLNVETIDKTRANPSALAKLKLTYREGTGFSGEGMLTDAGGKLHPVKVQIVPKGKGAYQWNVRDPGAPAGNDLIFGFDFLERVK